MSHQRQATKTTKNAHDVRNECVNLSRHWTNANYKMRVISSKLILRNKGFLHKLCLKTTQLFDPSGLKLVLLYLECRIYVKKIKFLRRQRNLT